MSIKQDYWTGADKSYGEIWDWLLARHKGNFNQGFTEYDLHRLHLKWKKLAAECTK